MRRFLHDEDPPQHLVVEPGGAVTIFSHPQRTPDEPGA
jgi:hypothetical protein